jgi:hypothetical protein
MKKFIITSILAALVTAGIAQDYPDEYLGLPGDNLNLYAVMKLFQESETLEGFERSLNDENSRINNLDLNGDNLIDYINVIDFVDGDVHTIVLRTALNRNETQDIAVFTVQRFRDGSVQIQLVGDEDLYGKNYIIEPIYDDNYAETPNPGYLGRSGSRVNVTVIRTTPFEIAAWPLVRFIYLPGYAVWHSSWYWGYYPEYWHPWRPFFWHYYYGYHYRWHPDYYSHYRPWHQHRYTRYNDFYYSGIRSHSPLVIANIKGGQYKSTYSHPEQRRDGEALYTRMNSDGNTGRSANPSANGQRRSNVSGSVTNRSSGTISGTSRRTANSVSSKSGTVRSSEKNTGGDRRTAPVSSSRPATRSSSGQNADISRRSEASNNNRPATKSSGQNASVSRRSAPEVSVRSSSRPAQSRKGATVRTSGSSSRNAGTSGSKSSRDSGSRTVSKKSEKSKNAESGNSTRRR